MDKKQIRNSILKKRREKNKNQIVRKGNLLKEKLFSLEEFRRVNIVMFFVSFDNEIYTHDMIREASEKKVVIVPKITDSDIFPSRIRNFNDLEKGKYGILEPIENDMINSKDIEVIFVPGIVFDKKGHRIGYGKGYYDKFLKNLDAFKIGLCMDFQIIDKLPNDPWDVKMDMIISEKSIIRV